MVPQDILVHLDDGPHCHVRVDVAFALARRFQAHLTGLWVTDIPATEYFFGASMPFATADANGIVDRLRQTAMVAAAAAEGPFRDRLRREDLRGEWRHVSGETPELLALHARYADLTIVGQPNPNERRDELNGDRVLVEPLMTSGRPVLAVPYAGNFTEVGSHVLVAWNASREAARAIHDAMPLLRTAKQVTVLAINPRQGIGGHGDVPASDISLHLARHGVTATAAHTVANDITDGQALLSYAADIGVDLIVAGGYGHSRAREMVFGGVTRTLIEEMTVPTFLSH